VRAAVGQKTIPGGLLQQQRTVFAAGNLSAINKSSRDYYHYQTKRPSLFCSPYLSLIWVERGAKLWKNIQNATSLQYNTNERMSNFDC
jgi:hypothetical protein